MIGLAKAIGKRCIDSTRELGVASMLFFNTIKGLFGRWPWRKDIFAQLYSIGILSVPVVLGTGIFTGMVLAVSSYFQLNKLGVSSLIGAIVNVSLVKQLGPILTALMLAGRVGSAITAELGTMKVTEQIDALKAMGADPIRHLVLPRFFAFIILSPLLTILSSAIGMIGGYIISVHVLHIESFHYWIQGQQYLYMIDIWNGLIKSVFFGASTAIICCHKGFATNGGAKGVGQATTSATTVSFMAILVINFFLTVLLETIF